MKRGLSILFFFIITTKLFATPITGITAFYRSGQVFVTWNNLSTTGVQYNLYRSSSPITTGAQLASAQNLGWVGDTSSENKRMTSIGGGVLNFLSIDSLGTPLSAGTGLFVATSVSNGNYYYAVTTTVSGIEDTTIVAGGNSLTTTISEQVSMPMPVLQQVRHVRSQPILFLYVQFLTRVSSNIYPVMTSCGTAPANFSLLKNSGTAPFAGFFKLHGGAGNFLSDTIGDTIIGAYSNVWNIGLDDWTSGGVGGTVWIGYNQNDNINATAKTVPDSGMDLMFTQIRIAYTIKWADKYLPLDSTKSIIAGQSDGGIGTIFSTSAIPEKLSIAYEYTGMFNLGFSNDPNGNVSTNTGGMQRKNCDYLFGTVSNNFLTNEGMNMYNLSNAGLIAHVNRDANYPVLFGVNGKNDALVGWYEKIAFYDSANANRLGGFYFWDMRTHGGGSIAWNIIPNYGRYSTGISYPAFSNCSANNNPGNGYANNGDSIGTINGILDWKNPTADSAAVWQVPLYVRQNLKYKYGNFPAPDSCTVDVTPRQLQHFKPIHGATINYQNIHNGKVVQAGKGFYDGDLIVVPQVKVYSDTTILRLTISPDSVDAQTTIPVKISASKLTLCQKGAYDTLTATGGSIYIWAANPAGVNSVVGGIGPTLIVVPAVTTTYTVIGKTINGAIGVDSIVIHVISPFSATITSTGDTTFCAGTGSDVLLASPSGTFYTYTWYLDSVLVNGVSGNQYNATDSGTVYCIVSAPSSTCPSSTSNFIRLQILPPPVVDLTTARTLICPGDTSKLTASTDSGKYIYSWYKNDTLIVGASLSNYYATDSGSYKCLITDSLGCYSYTQNINIADSANCISGLNKLTVYSNQLLIYPNPTSGKFIIKTNDNQNGYSLEIYNVMGDMVYQSFLNNPQTAVNLSSQPAGMYFVYLKSEEGVEIGKVVVTK